MERLSIDEVIAHCNRQTKDYERLNGKTELENADISLNFIKQYWEHRQVAEWLKQLKVYKDTEEQGLLLRLPCKIGDIVYSVTRNFISEYTICSIEKYNEGFFFNWRCEKGIYINVRGFTDYDIGKTVFLTKEEAEQALKQMGE